MMKTLARQRAAQQLSYGHFRPSAGTAYVRCPVCKRDLHVQFLPWTQPTPVLRQVLTSHLVEDH